MHVPTATNVTVEPETVQIVDVIEEKLTASPDDEVPLTANGAPNAWFDNAPKVIV